MIKSMEHIEDMTYTELLDTVYDQFGDNFNPSDGYTFYETSRMNLLLELVYLLEDMSNKSPLLRRCLYLAKLEQKCLSLDMAEPLEPKISYGDQTALAS